MLLNVQHIETDDQHHGRLVMKFEKFSLRHRLERLQSKVLQGIGPFMVTGPEHAFIEKDIVHHRLYDGDNLLAVLPKGSRESFCLRLPTYATIGFTVVISPLRSLMCDQNAALEIKQCFFENDEMGKSNTINCADVKLGQLRLLYVEPQNLIFKNFQTYLKKITGTIPIHHLIIDGVHSVSEWSEEFKPCYTQIAKFSFDLRKTNPEMSMVAITDTNSDLIKQDIITHLGLKNHEVKSSDIFYRPNLSFQVVKINNETQKSQEFEKTLLNDIPAALQTQSIHDVFKNDHGFQSHNSKFSIYANTYKDNQDYIPFYLNRTQQILSAHQDFYKTQISKPLKKKFFLKEKTRPFIYQYSYSVSSDLEDTHSETESLITTKGPRLESEHIQSCFSMHMSINNSITDWYLEAGYSAIQGYRSHNVQIINLPPQQCENDMLQRCTGTPICAESELNQCCFEPKLCDYGKQYLYILKQCFIVEDEVIRIILYLDQLITNHNEDSNLTYIQVKPEIRYTVELALHRLSLIKIIDTYYLDFKNKEPIFIIEGFTLSLDNHQILHGIIRFLKNNDPTSNKTYTGYSINHLIDSGGLLEVIKILYHHGIQTGLQKKIDSGGLVNYTQHSLFFDKTALYLALVLHYLYSDFKKRDFFRLWNIKQQIKSSTCRWNNILKTLEPIPEDWQCGFCDNCIPDLNFQKQGRPIPLKVPNLKQLDFYLKDWLEKYDAPFDYKNIKRFILQFSEFRSNIYQRSLAVIENTPRNIKALFLACQFAPKKLKNKHYHDLFLCAVQDLELSQINILFKTAPASIHLRRSLFEIMNNEYGNLKSQEGEAWLYQQAMNLKLDIEKISILGSRTLLNTIKKTSFTKCNEQLKDLLGDF